MDKKKLWTKEKFKLRSLPLRMPPKQMLVTMALSIFAAEALVMYILGKLEITNYVGESLLDSTFLLMFLTPVYLFFYRPFWEAQKQHEEQVRYLSQQLIKTVEDERKRISCELHDQSGQSLTAMQFSLQTLKRSLPEDDCGCTQLTDNMIVQVAQLSHNLRDFASRLRPETFEQLGLISSLEIMFREFTRTYREIEIEHRLVRKSDVNGAFYGAGDLAVYRVCQESLTNIVKHAEASKVIIQLDLVVDKLILQVEDNGVGFDVNSYWLGKQSPGIGLLGMRERVGQLGGKFAIQSRPKQGTRITAEFPLHERCQNGNN